MTDTTQDAERAALAALLAEDIYAVDETPETESGFGFVEVNEKGSGGRRWTETMTRTIKSTKTERHWQYDWERGLTECQEHEWPDFSQADTLVEVEPHTETKTITVTKYRRKVPA